MDTTNKSLLRPQQHKARVGGVSLRVAIVVATTALVVMVCVGVFVPMIVGWRTSLSALSQATEDIVDKQLTTHRKSVIDGVASDILSKITELVNAVSLICRLTTEATLNSTTASNINLLHATFQPVSYRFSSTNSIFLAWTNSFGQHIFVNKLMNDQSRVWSAFDGTANDTMLYYQYATTSIPGVFIPTTKVMNVTKGYDVTTRTWFQKGMQKTVPFRVFWLTPWISGTTPGEGIQIGVAARHLTTHQAVGLAAFTRKTWETYMKQLKHSANGQAFLIHGDGLELIVASDGITVPSDGSLASAVVSSSWMVQQASMIWNTTGRPAEFTIDDTESGFGITFVDVKSITVDDTDGIDLWLFLLTPRSDYMSEVEDRQDDATTTSDKATAVALGVAGVLFVLFLILSVLAGLYFSRPLSQIRTSLEGVTNMDFLLTMTSPATKPHKRSGISELDKLQGETEYMADVLRAMGKFLPAPIVKHVLRDSLEPRVSVTKMDATILFLSVADFAALVTRHGADKVIQGMAEMFEEVSRILTSHGGVIGSYSGGRIMCFWGCPEPTEDPQERACSAVDDIMVAVDDMNKRKPLQMLVQIGVHCGQVHCGTIGSTTSLQYTVIGENVQVASRLESLNGRFGTTALVSDQVRKKAGSQFQWRCLGVVASQPHHHHNQKHRGSDVLLAATTPSAILTTTTSDGVSPSVDDNNTATAVMRVHEFMGMTGSATLTGMKLAKVSQYSEIDKHLMATSTTPDIIDDIMPTLEDYITQNPEDTTIFKYLQYCLVK